MVQRYEGTSDLEEENLHHNKSFYNLVDDLKKNLTHMEFITR